MEITINLYNPITKLLVMAPVLTACNVITMWAIDNQSKYALGACINASTLPAFYVNIINQLAIYVSQSYNIPYNKFAQYGVMGLCSAFAPKIALNCLNYEYNHVNDYIENNISDIITSEDLECGTNIIMFPNVTKLGMKIDIIQKANPSILVANTLVQTVLIDMIWNGFPWSSNDKAEDITQDDYELGVQPQDFDYNEYVMTAA